MLKSHGSPDKRRQKSAGNLFTKTPFLNDFIKFASLIGVGQKINNFVCPYPVLDQVTVGDKKVNIWV